ncbi:cuticle protein 16.5-like isoform X1 [Ochlerotatus camptorhynchus]|uniref:cuticle protein 16.5-like isoform X1 n=1 Tax=Ochlerotatus camptorhynchus TaxID=644619 RepID=UPI0031D992BE
MFRLVVLSTVLAIAAAAPGASLVASAGPLAYHTYAAVPTVVAQKEISYQKSIIEEPTVTHVGNIERKIPTGYSHQSFTQYHNKQVAEHVYAPAVKKTIVETPIEKTTYHAASVATPAITYAAPAAIKTHYVEAGPALTYAAPLAKTHYVEAGPALAYAAPLTKSHYYETAPALTYAAAYDVPYASSAYYSGYPAVYAKY